MKTFFVDCNSIKNNLITLVGDEHNHLKNVLRLKPNEQVKVVYGNDFNYFCEILEVNKNNTLLKIIKTEQNNANPKVNLTVFMSLIKNDNLNLTIQKLTELGVSTIVPLICRYNVVKDVNSKHEKLQLISNQSIKQCGRSKPVKVLSSQKISEINLEPYDLVIFANESEKSTTINDVMVENYKNVAIIIGPEGGFAPIEKQILQNSKAKSVTLGNRILRAETAAIMLSAIVLYNLGEYK